jgi:predicted lipid-binding transport protein (Tim44 family)
MLRALIFSGLLAVAPVTVIGASAASAQAPAGKQCDQSGAAKAKRSMFGSMLGGLASSVLGRAGVPSSVGGVSLPVGSLLSDAIINLLDCKEQQQAAQATDQAVRGGVGTQVAWKSESRPNVSGRSTVTAEEKLADGGNCLTVNDVVIVDGEETTVPKRMCRAAGASGYAKA